METSNAAPFTAAELRSLARANVHLEERGVAAYGLRGKILEREPCPYPYDAPAWTMTAAMAWERNVLRSASAVASRCPDILASVASTLTRMADEAQQKAGESK